MSTPDALAKTPLYDWHVANGGRMVDFAGWAMPVQYGSIVDEHHATRNAVGLFDISHMGRLLFSGADAEALLDSISTRRVTDLKPGQIRYSLICNEQGGVLDDVLIYRIELEDGVRSGSGRLSGFGMVVNASNRPKIVEWINGRIGNRAVELEDISAEYAMIAVQGPKAIELLDPLTDHPLTSLRYYTGAETNVDGCGCYISRTGYTGEDGCEIVVHADLAAGLWESLHAKAEEVDGSAVGLAARNTLRLEAGMPLYGHELTEEINPIQAGLGFAVTLKDRDFVGRDALTAATQDKGQRVRVGLQLEGRRAPREGYPVLQENEVVGEVTSGTFSPTLNKPIAMAYVKPTAAAPGEPVAVDARGTHLAATVAPPVFYERGK
ncbi:Glycine cleavage system T protein [Posidoniimonas corsicana]|uniref:Aminomethyltransferase n=1 Tax=Posidoniimonas corsicana TaxID=1938618 RepID=A0A5C5V5F4_9BACT|nr:glycine cleavage system aminomethyltransferase GcvT [Posidoniimonas corsicana]TWT33541.1 Glycine cleavage system T protein [Posidoniimonas corsicana]